MNNSFFNTTSLQRKSIDVFIRFYDKETLVGRLIVANRLIYFKYDQDFLSTGLNLSPIKLKFDDSIQVAKPDPFNGIFGLFDDSLPDGWGMLLMNRALEKKGLSLNEINVLDHLSYIGDTGKGALVYRPTNKNIIKGGNIDIDELITSMGEIYEGESQEVIAELLDLGGSSGGARPKANVGYNPKTNQLIHGKDILPVGFEHWILKFPSSVDPADIANIEYAYHKMAVSANILMSECKLLESTNGLKVFATKRFDRIQNNRVHMHSMAGLVHDNFRRSSIDYGHIMDTAYELEQTAQARKNVLRLAAFNVFSHNRDDHSKNFSWLMDSQGKWTMSPAYDLTFSSNSINEHSTRVDGEGENPGEKELLELARIFSISKPNQIIDEVLEAIAQWPFIAKECGVSKLSLNRIQATLDSIRELN